MVKAARAATLGLSAFLVACSSRTLESSRAEALTPKVSSEPDMTYWGECGAVATPARPSSLPPPTVTWETWVLSTDREASRKGACASLDARLTPLDRLTDLSRPAIRAECETAASTLPSEVRHACRAVCAARRWIEARSEGRRRALTTLTWVDSHMDETFERIVSCEGIRKPFSNSFGDPGLDPIWACLKLTPPPKETSFRIQFLTEPVSWRENGSILESARAIGVQFLRAQSSDTNAPWLAEVSRCKRDNRPSHRLDLTE